MRHFWTWLADPLPAPAWIKTETFHSYGGTITRRIHWDHLFRVLAARGTP